MILETIPVSIGTDDEAIFNKRHLKPLSDPEVNMKKKFFLLILSPTFNHSIESQLIAITRHLYSFALVSNTVE